MDLYLRIFALSISNYNYKTHITYLFISFKFRELLTRHFTLI